MEGESGSGGRKRERETEGEKGLYAEGVDPCAYLVRGAYIELAPSCDDVSWNILSFRRVQQFQRRRFNSILIYSATIRHAYSSYDLTIYIVYSIEAGFRV